MPTHLAQVEKPTTTYSLPHQVLQFDLSEEFPILTTKYVAFKSAVLEMLWIYQAESNDVRWLQDRGIKIWNEWPYKAYTESKDYKGETLDHYEIIFVDDKKIGASAPILLQLQLL